MADIELHPVQVRRYPYEAAKLNSLVTSKAAEVYDALWPGQPLKRVNERGGYGAGEVIAFLYAHSFPREEWQMRVDEALKGMRGI